jgi:hypothetical protein
LSALPKALPTYSLTLSRSVLRNRQGELFYPDYHFQPFLS